MHGVPGDRVGQVKTSVPLYVAKNRQSQSDGDRVGRKIQDPPGHRAVDEPAGVYFRRRWWPGG